MSLRCPKCSAPSPYAPHEVGAAGRMARCARCSTSWLARHLAGDVYRVEVPAVRPMVAREPLIIEGEVVRATPRRRPAETARDRPVLGRPRANPARPQPSRSRPWALAAGISLAVLLALAVPIAGAIPGIAGLFSAGDGIVLDQVASSSLKLGGSDAILVEGRLTNASRAELPVPAIRISLRKDDGGEAYSWLVEPSALHLAAGASIGFRSALNNPVPGASRIAASLAPREQQIGMR